jgi:hypothetical protein
MALAGVFVDVARGVSAVLVATLVGYGDSIIFGRGEAMGVEADDDGGVGVATQRRTCEGHFKPTAWITALLMRFPNEQRKRAAQSKLILRAG